ncbi:ubiquitin carboxyl-terminal hydrolase 16 [Orussus abietinus]|uniref:ubiquitin carboxyl-terminal hydrolase 16 n=1 Tax=Orussus abietinus TaxID=222816 RepID=UPI0006264352|nr:ubiquitin carboxyl-terminal hydrolase 16 [Orussus abietinus]XP_012272866.1 ubiquitin carboxyl-terminal hydrolase 16 [Orussus abietinus]
MENQKNRQQDPKDEASEEDWTPGKTTSTEGRFCPHVSWVSRLPNVERVLDTTGVSTECSACKECKDTVNNEIEDEEFAAETPSLWICLTCGNQACGREGRQHALQHYKIHDHCVAANINSSNLWCYRCDIEPKKADVSRVIRFLSKYSTIEKQPRIYVQPVRISAPMCQKQTVVNSNNETKNALGHFPKVGGLANLGNTCFFNAVLQCLAQTPFLTKVLDDLRKPGQRFVLPGGKYKGNGDSEEIELPPISGTLEKWGNFTSILHKTLTEMQNSTGNQTYVPSELLNAFKTRTMQCMDGGQHDSHELLRHLLELVRNEDLRRYQSVILKEVGLSGKTRPECVDGSMKSRVKFYGNQASARLLGPELVFSGVLVSTLECLECHHTSQRTEPFLDLSLPVMADKPQPPILKRKKSGFEESLDILGNNISNVPSKHQLKKERKAARKKIRKIRRQHAANINNDSLSNLDSTEESDADAEDSADLGTSRPEIGESGYVSEKASAVTSPVSPVGSPYIRAIELFHETMPAKAESSLNNVNSPSPTDVSMGDILTRSTWVSPSPERLGSATSDDLTPSEKEKGVLPVWLLSVVTTNNSDATTPEEPVFSPSDSSNVSKESPGSPEAAVLETQNAEKIDRPVSRLDLVEDESRSDKEDPLPRRSNPDADTDEFQSGQSKEEESSISCLAGESQTINGVHEVTCSLSRMSVSSETQQSPRRYLTKEGECSIQSCLNQFTALELMNGSNKVRCEACTARENKGKQGPTKAVCTPSTKQYLISRVPAVLILHLKRFQAQHRMGFRKVTKTISFPMLLDLDPVCKGHGNPKLYALYGVVEHSGTLHGGHYVAYVKARQPLNPDDRRWSLLPSKVPQDTDESSSESSSESEANESSERPPTPVEAPPGRWYYVSDSRVMEVNESTVLQSQAYLLFYERLV